MTREGLRLTVVGSVGCLVGFVAGWDGPLILGGAILALVLCSLLYTLRPGHAADLTYPHVVEGPRLAPLSLEVITRLSRRLGVYAEMASDPHPRRLHRFIHRPTSSSVSVPIDTRRRRVGPIGPVHIVCRDPFGLSRRLIATTEPVEVTITPRVASVTLPDSKHNRGDDGREIPVGWQPNRLSETLREYVPGDEPRRLHWRSSARLGKLMIRQEVMTVAPDSLVVLDRRSSSWNTAPPFSNDNSVDNFEQAVDVLAGVIEALTSSNRDLVVLCFDDGLLRIDRTAGQGFLRALTRVEMTTSLDESHHRNTGGAQQGRGSPVILITRGAEGRRAAAGWGPNVTVLEPDLTGATS